MTAVETNHARVRILIQSGSIEGLENSFAVKALEDELAARGLSEYVEIRYFDGHVHAKAVLIDDEFLIIGSQNFHYSAFGKGGLTEYNLGVDDPRAVEDFRRMFDYHWENGVGKE